MLGIHLNSTKIMFKIDMSTDDNECGNLTQSCGENANCTNTQGSYYCVHLVSDPAATRTSLLLMMEPPA